MGVVYHANYLQYFDVGRTEYMRERGLPYAEVEKRGYILSVVDVGVKYRRSAHYDELLELVTRVAHSSRTTVTFEYELMGPGGELLTTGHTRLTCLDGRDNRPSKLPPELRALLEQGASSGRKPIQAPSEAP